MKAIVDNFGKESVFEGMASFQNEEYRRDRYVIPVQTYDWFGNPADKVVSNTNQSLIYPTDVLNIKDIHNPAYLMQANNMQYQYYSFWQSVQLYQNPHQYSLMYCPSLNTHLTGFHTCPVRQYHEL